MEYQVTFHADFYIGGKQYEATLDRTLSFVPFENMHVGPSQFMTVCQIHWLEGNKFRADIAGLDTHDYRTNQERYTMPEIISMMKAGCGDPSPGEELLFNNWKFFLVENGERKPVDL